MRLKSHRKVFWMDDNRLIKLKFNFIDDRVYNNYWFKVKKQDMCTVQTNYREYITFNKNK